MIRAFIPIYALRGLLFGGYYALWQNELLADGFTVSGIASIVAIQTLLATLVDIPSGVIADRFGHKRTSVFGFALYVAAFGLPCFLHAHSAFLVAIPLIGVADATINGALESWAAELQEEAQGEVKALSFARRDQAMRVGMICGGLVIPFLVSQLSGVKSIAWLLYLCIAALLLVAGWSTPGAKREKKRDVVDFRWWRTPGITSLLCDPRLRWIYLGIFFFGAADGVISTCFWPSLRAWGITSPMVLGCVMTGMSLSRIAGIQFWKNSGRLEGERTPGLSVLGSSLLFLLFALIGNPWIAIPLWLVRVAVVSAYFSTIQVLVLKDPRIHKQRATVLSIAGVLGSLGEIVSATVIGEVMTGNSGLGLACTCGAMLTALSGVLLIAPRAERAASVVGVVERS